ncbi:MAG: ABC transporter permease [Imperialibacter sp.]|uniref:ABC transporter permease n=1 Tax=Imperialibacter sp. TaxID=2038411 RepID=UPI0032EBEF6F
MPTLIKKDNRGNKRPEPPAWATGFLHWYCREELAEEIEGDIREIFEETASAKNSRLASLQYVWHVLKFCQPFAWKKRNNKYNQTQFNNWTMLKNYIIIAYRSLLKKVGYSLVNIFGLAVGITVCLLIVIFVQYELSFDNFQKDDVYRIALKRVYPEREVNYAFIPHSIGPQLKEDFPEVIQSANLLKAFAPIVVRYNDNYFYEENILFADSTLFEVLEIPLIEGDAETALKEPNSLLITESMAKKYFGDESPMGKSMETGQGNFIVRAVAKDYPGNSHMAFDFIGSMSTFPFIAQPNWIGFDVLTYLKLQPGANPATLEKQFPEFVKKYAAGPIQQRNGISYDEYIAAGNGYIYTLQPLKDIYLHSNLEGEIKANGNITYVYIFISAAIFILLIACINFMNLSTARSTERAKEVGIRKVLGSVRNQLIGQFITESVLLTLISFVLAMVALVFILPFFADVSHRALTLNFLLAPVTIAVIVLVIFCIGFLAGVYPAFVLSSFQPAAVLKGKMQTSKYGVFLRNGLVVFQFAISIGLISCTMIIFNQMSFMLNKSLGFEKDHVVVIESAFNVNRDNFQNPDADVFQIRSRYETFENEIKKVPGVKNATYTSAMPGDVMPGFIVRVPGSGEKESMVARGLSVDESFFETMQIELLEGRLFSKSFNDSLSMILAASTVAKLGLEDPIGKKIINVNNGGDTDITYTIIGVVNDFHFQSLHVGLEPVAIIHVNSPNTFINKMVVKVDPSELKASLAGVEATWNQFTKDTPLRYYYLDENLKRFYDAEKTSGDMFTIFTSLAIMIACIGLFGLAAYTAGQKRKEIGVRKVMGASIFNIVLLLSRDFTKLILIAVLVAVPAAWWGMDKWLDNFAYRIDISVWTFFLAALTAVVIGWLTVGYQSFTAASVNPVKSLRSE